MRPLCAPPSVSLETTNVNQAHSRSHPWNIKVRLACSNCRKRKVKCDGRPTCHRCIRRREKCSYEQAHAVIGEKKRDSRKKTPLLAEEQDSSSDSARRFTRHCLLSSDNLLLKDTHSDASSQYHEGDIPAFRGHSPHLQEQAIKDVNQKTLSPDLYDILVNAVEDGNVIRHLMSRGSSFSQAEAHAECDDRQREDSDTPVLQEPAIPAGFVVTNRSVVRYLIRKYFEYLHPYWMVVDKERFMAQFAFGNPPPDPLLLVAICAAGAKYSDNSGLSAETGNFPTIGEQFMAHARILLRTRFDTPSIPTVQALLILYWCLVQTGQARLKVIYVGIATRMAQELGLNRPLDAARLDASEARVVQMRKVIWWSCYQADRWTSATSGRPMLISDVDCLVDYPASLDGAEDDHISSFCHLTDLAKILGHVIRNLYTSSTLSACSTALFSQMESSLQSWLDSSPSFSNAERSSQQTTSKRPSKRFSIGGEGSSTITNRAYAASVLQDRGSSTGSYSTGCYLLLYHFVRIMLYKPFICGGVIAPVLLCTPASSQDRCRDSAAVICSVAKDLVFNGCLDRHSFNIIYVSLCSAATVHRHVITSPKNGLPEIADLLNLTYLLRSLQTSGRFMIEARLLHSVFNDFLPQTHLDLQKLTWAREEIQRPLDMTNQAPYKMQPMATNHSSPSSGRPIPCQAQRVELLPLQPLTLPTLTSMLTRQTSLSKCYLTPQLQQYGRDLSKHQQKQLQNWADVIRPPNTPALA